jgi:hypothetical protein
MSKTTRPSFLLYKSFHEPIKNLTLEEKGLLFDAIFNYQNNLEIINLPPQVLMAFSFFKNQFNLDEGKYQIVIDRNKSNGSKGGRPKKEETQTNPENPVGYLEPKKADKEKEKEIEKDKENDKEIIIPYFIDTEIWNGFLEMRIKAKAKPTNLAIKGILEKLTIFEDKKQGSANESLKNSIESNWKGVFEPKDNFNKPKSNLGWLNK